MASLVDQSSAKGKHKDYARSSAELNEWYNKKKPLFIDLVGEFGGQELFVLDGDSLLRKVLADEALGFDDDLQMLPSIYQIEKFLSLLLARGCNFHIVFFEDNRMLCIPANAQADHVNDSKYLLLRAALILHLRIASKDAGKSLLYTFRNTECVEFREYVKEHRPYYFMVHDGSNDSAHYQKRDTSEDAFLLRMNILQILKMGLHVALINEAVFMDVKVLTLVLDSTAASKKLPGGYDRLVTLQEAIVRERHTQQPATLMSLDLQVLDGVKSLGEHMAIWVFRADPDLGSLPLRAAFLHHLSALRSMPLPERTRIISHLVPTNNGPRETEFHNFLHALASEFTGILDLPELQEFIDDHELEVDVLDLIDARLFRSMLAPTSDDKSDKGWCTKESAKFASLVRHIPTLADKDFDTIDWNEWAPLHGKPITESISVQQPQVFALQPFSHPLFDEFFSKINKSVTPASSKKPSSTRKQLVSSKGFPGSSRWQSLKSAHDEQPGGSNSWKLRGEQYYMRSMHKYASSLTGALGNMLEPKLVITTGEAPKKPKDNQKENPKFILAGTKKLSKAERIKLQNTANQAMKKSARKATPFKALVQKSQTSSIEEIITSFENVEKFEAKLEAAEKQSLVAQIAAYKLNLLFQLWLFVTDIKAVTGRLAADYDVVARMFYEVYALKKAGNIHPQLATFVDEIFTEIGFSPLQLGSGGATVTKAVPPKKGKSKANAPPPVADAIPEEILDLPVPWHQRYKIRPSLTEFQLLYCGPYMDRNMGSAKDDRVPFDPDKWQREVLDEIDAGNGLLVVAPTSAGKTFISFYAMEKVMRESDEDVIVYVAPTKALCNQIAAEVQSRFRKNFTKSPGKTVWAIQTRDYKINNPTNCQILITVPHVLQTLLFDPANATNWSPRVKRIIFDEVHSIGQAEDGVVWEQLLMLAPCPIIALSATVGNPEELGQWIGTAQQNIGAELKIVTWPHRFSDLRKYSYLEVADKGPAAIKAIRGSISTLDDDDTVRLIHPVVAMEHPSATVLRDLTLEPRECLALWKALSEGVEDMPSDLAPEKFFGQLITKGSIIAWSEALKKFFATLLDTKKFDAIQTHLAKQFGLEDYLNTASPPALGPEAEQSKHIVETSDNLGDADESDLESTTASHSDESESESIPDNWEEDSSGSSSEDGSEDSEDDEVKELVTKAEDLSLTEADDTVDSNVDVINSTLPLLRTLQAQSALPVILFSYDRAIVEELCRTLVQQLQVGEDEHRKTSGYVQRLEGWKAWKKAMEHRKLQKTKEAEREKKEKKEKKIKGGEKKERVAQNEGITAAMKAAEEEAAIASEYALFDPEDPDEGFTFANLRACTKDDIDEDFAMLKKGGIPEVFMKAMRRGIGIHHDGLSRKLRECVERLFRKGYLCVVISTGTLALGINMPCATTGFIGDHLVLNPLNYQQASGRAGRRGFDLVGNVVFHGIPNNKISRLMTAKLPSLNGHFPVTMSLVLRLFVLLGGSNNSKFAKQMVENFLKQTGKQEDLHNLRFSIECLQRQGLLDRNGNVGEFAGLTASLYYTDSRAFVFHTLLRRGVLHEVCKDVQESAESVCEKLMLILANIFCPKPLQQAQLDNIKNLRRGAVTSVVLLPDMDDTIVNVLSEQNRDTLQLYTGYAQSYVDMYLKDTPDNKLPFTGTIVAGAATPGNGIKSSFVQSESYDSIDELYSTIRNDIPLDPSSVPYIPLNESSSSSKKRTEVALNAYIYDFYHHGSLQALIDANGFRASEVWFALKDFSTVLSTIISGIKKLLQLPEGDHHGDYHKELDIVPDDDDKEVYHVVDDDVDSKDDGDSERDEVDGVLNQDEVDEIMKGKARVRFDLSNLSSAETQETTGTQTEEQQVGGKTKKEIYGNKGWSNLLVALTMVKKNYDQKLENVGATKKPTAKKKNKKNLPTVRFEKPSKFKRLGNVD